MAYFNRVTTDIASEVQRSEAICCGGTCLHVWSVSHEIASAFKPRNAEFTTYPTLFIVN
jgi:hypothetical protein